MEENHLVEAVAGFGCLKARVEAVSVNRDALLCPP